MSTTDTLIRDTINELYPNETVEQRFKLRGVLNEVLEDRRNIHCPGTRYETPDRARMIRFYNRRLHAHLRAES